MIRTRFKRTLISAAVLITSSGLAARVWAGVTVYTNRVAWEAAVGGNIQTENFDSRSNGPLSFGLNDAGLIDIRVNGAVGINQWSFGEMIGETRSQSGQTQDLIFPAPVKGFGGDWGDPIGNSRLVAIFGGETIQFDNHLAMDGAVFVGFVSTTPVSEARISDEGLLGNEVYDLDNLSFSVVPEPTTLGIIVMAAALPAHSIFRRRA